jgi:hypothetical protein
VDLHAAPSSVVVHYEREIAAEGIWQAQCDRLFEPGPDTTLWESEFRFDGLLMRLLGFLMPGFFRKQSRQHMHDFKAFRRTRHGRPPRDELTCRRQRRESPTPGAGGGYPAEAPRGRLV